MILFGDRVVCSTGDLVTAARCEFALLRALDAELGLVTPVDISSPGALTHAPTPAVDPILAALRDRHSPGFTHIRIPAPAHSRATGDAAFTQPRTATAGQSRGAWHSTLEETLAGPHAAAEPAIAAVRAAHELTVAALRENLEVVAAPVVFDGMLAAQCDFLLRDSDPETHDHLPAGVATRHTVVGTLLTLAATADALRRTGFRPAPHARMWVDGVPALHSLADISVIYQARRTRLESIVDAKLGELLPVQWGDRRFLACGSCPTCTAELESRRDLLLVAGMRPATRAQLRDAGITTVDRLAATDATPGIPTPALTALRRQAELQLHRERTGHPAHTLLTPAALATLPAPAPGDLFLSVALADPAPGRITSARGDLIVTLCAADHLPTEVPSEALSDPSATAPRTTSGPLVDREAAAGFEMSMRTVDFTAFVGEEGRPSDAQPAASLPEQPAAKADGHGGPAPAQQNRRGHEFCSTAADSIRGGTDRDAQSMECAVGLIADSDIAPGPELETHALGFVPEPAVQQNRAANTVRSFVIRVDLPDPKADAGVLQWDSGVKDDSEALLEFLMQRHREYPEMRVHHYRGNARGLLSALGERYPVGEDMVAEILPATVDLYPIVRAALVVGERSYGLLELPPNQGESDSSAESVLRLRDWLLNLASEHGVRPGRRPWFDGAFDMSPDEVEAALREFGEGGGLAPEERSEAQTAAAFTAAVLGYHRRERQPLWWAHADRLDHPVEEWADTPGVLVADWAAVDTKWHSTDAGHWRRYLTLTGRLGTGNAPPPGTAVLTLYDRSAPGMAAAPGRRALAHATVLGCALDPNFDDVVRVVELLPDGCEPYDELPSAIAPCPPGRNVDVEEALEDIAHHLLVTLPQVPATAVFDVLCRRTPRLRSSGALPEVRGDHAAAITAALLELDNSYVAVQGPPGTGKTDTTARAVEKLVTRHKWRVGVVARSHAAVEHTLDAVVQVGVLPELVAKADSRSVASEWLGIEASRYPRFLDNAVNGCVVGGLPADFADPERIPRDSLDLLVIADAGKFPLADAVAVALCARNLLLVGDPAPAAGHGIHPEPVHESVLGRLFGAHRTLPAAYGYFLDRTWRMHPRMCGPVSRLRYENRLRSNETVTLARELDGIEPGVRTVPVEHHGNGTESAEEAREIVRQVRNLLGLPWHTGAVTRRLHPHDILVVAPYHAQVARIRTLLSRARIEDVLVGTPDHFHGREAAVVLVSMTTSAPKDAPHGIGTLLSRHWLTSAISRAMWAAVIVRSPLLTEYLPATTAELSDLAAVLQLDRV
ncbi:bifunctional RecB family nuclease/DEAD/DEAH box helicase [Nocardia huaxiensis]|uniref:bifunctional RecB family nuclease/DEAD/DEAH box helicase n=1 Tax=Nocardia huaxiensis TaxID=2755382 RepID=UPI001E5D8E72|nr:bifunctional RecB family nuclease/DEAD/DEAH box helicase [Nocardia huaxiensis]UFS93375.1 AAA domain-containing protein [Nocardia huaxiensis]